MIRGGLRPPLFVLPGFGGRARSLAERDRGLRSNSSAVGTTALRVMISNGVRARPKKSFSTEPEKFPLRRKFLTSRSSSEWYEMTTSRPPGRSTLRLCSSAILSASISPLTSMRSA